MSVSMLNDILSLLSKEHTAINDILKNIADFEREYYKAEIRRNILELEEFDKDQARASVQNAIEAELKSGEEKLNAKFVFEVCNLGSS